MPRRYKNVVTRNMITLVIMDIVGETTRHSLLCAFVFVLYAHVCNVMVATSVIDLVDVTI